MGWFCEFLTRRELTGHRSRRTAGPICRDHVHMAARPLLLSGAFDPNTMPCPRIPIQASIVLLSAVPSSLSAA